MNVLNLQVPQGHKVHDIFIQGREGSLRFWLNTSDPQYETVRDYIGIQLKDL